MTQPIKPDSVLKTSEQVVTGHDLRAAREVHGVGLGTLAVMATTYLSGFALRRFAQAQAVMDRHIVSCAVCGTSRPCAERREAEAVFLRYERLPQRTAGLTTAGQHSRPGFSWLPRT